MVYTLVTAVCIITGVILADQITKLLVLEFLYEGQLTLIEGFFSFTYVENRGMAFGLLEDQRWIFLVLSTVGILALVAYLVFFVRKPLPVLAVSLVIGGGIGNMIDRIRLGFVVDFIDFHGIWQYVFNVADAAVCIGAALFVLDAVLDLVKDAKQKSKEEKPSSDAPLTEEQDG
jgi:signal peptidase II